MPNYALPPSLPRSPLVVACVNCPLFRLSVRLVLVLAGAGRRRAVVGAATTFLIAQTQEDWSVFAAEQGRPQ